MWFFNKNKESKKISAKDVFEKIKNKKIIASELYEGVPMAPFLIGMIQVISVILAITMPIIMIIYVPQIAYNIVNASEIDIFDLYKKAASILTTITIVLFGLYYFCKRKKILKIRKEFKKEINESKNHVELLIKIFDKLDNEYFLENIESIMNIHNFSNEIKDEHENYIKNKISENNFKNTIFKNKCFLKTYMKKMNLKDVVKFYLSKEDRLIINKCVSDIEFLKLRKSIIDPQIEEYIESGKSGIDDYVYKYLIQIEGDRDYIGLLKNRLGIIKEESNLLNQLNRNVKNVVF